MKPISIGIIGFGSHVKRNILPALEKIKDVNITAILTRDRNSLTIPQTLSSVKIFEDEKEFFKQNTFSTVYIASPNSLHVPQATLAIKSGKHVLVEKPVGTDFKSIARLVNLAKKSNLVLMEGLMYLYHPMAQFLKALIKEKEEKLKAIDILFTIPELPSQDIRNKKKLAGGAFNDMGPYGISFIVNSFQRLFEKKYFHLIKENGMEVDTRGLLIGRAGQCEVRFRWGFGLPYSNKIEISCKDEFIEVERPFSKPIGKAINVFSTNLNGTKESIWTGDFDHFFEMFNTFFQMVNGEMAQTTLSLETHKLMDSIRSEKTNW